MFQIAMFSVFFALLLRRRVHLLEQDQRKPRLRTLRSAGRADAYSADRVSDVFGTGMAILESVANGQTKVREWQGFNLFDHIGEMTLFAIAAAVSAYLPLCYWLHDKSKRRSRVDRRLDHHGFILSHFSNRLVVDAR